MAAAATIINGATGVMNDSAVRNAPAKAPPANHVATRGIASVVPVIDSTSPHIRFGQTDSRARRYTRQ